jgi:hypothetical protein
MVIDGKIIMPGIDNLNELIENIEKDGFNFVLGIVKPGLVKDSDIIEIFTNTGDESLEKLLRVLREHQKNRKQKERGEIKIESQ